MICSTDVFPGASGDYSPDCGLTDAVQPRQSTLGDAAKGVEAPDTPDFISIEFGLRKLLTTSNPFRMSMRSAPVSARNSFRMGMCPIPISGCYAAFIGSVSHIVFVGSKKKVCRINAGWDIAQMADEKPVGDWPHAQLIGNTMSTEAEMTNRKIPIAIGDLGPRPQPAPARPGLVNFGPEAGFVLRRDLRNGTTLNSHNVLQVGHSWSERRAA